MKKVFALLFLMLCLGTMSAKEMVILSGKVIDAYAMPIDSVSVVLMNDKFDTLSEVLTNSEGDFTMEVEKGAFFCLYAICLADDNKPSLECWKWDIALYKNRHVIIN